MEIEDHPADEQDVAEDDTEEAPAEEHRHIRGFSHKQPPAT